MIRVALKGIALHKTRAVLTTLAIVLGVAMVTGAYVQSDTMINSADRLAAKSYDHVEAVVTRRTSFQKEYAIGEATSVPAALLDRVRQVPGVEAAVGDITQQAKMIGKDGKVLGSGPYFAAGVDATTPGGAELSPFTLTDGRFPQAKGEVTIDRGSAKKEGWKVGDTIGITARGPVERYEVVGITKFGGADKLGVATVAIFNLAQAQELFGKAGGFDAILVNAAPGVDGAQLRRDIAAALPQYKVQTAAAQDRYTLDDLDMFVGVLQKILLAFGFVSIFVGAMIIANTMSITIAQRIRELAMLRTVGASRRQIMKSVVFEALAMGVIGSIIGIAFGLVLAMALGALFKAVELDLPDTGTVFQARTAIVAAAVGIGVTLVAALGPARRAMKIQPVAALREGADLGGESISRRRTIVAAVITTLGVAGTLGGNFAGGMSIDERLPLIGIGALLLFRGVAMLMPRFVRPIASTLGRPAEAMGGVAGSLARRNSVRKPARTSATAAALMIGVALVTFVAVLGAALSNSAKGDLRKQITADYVVAGQDGWSPIATKAKTAVADSPGVEFVTGIRQDEARAFGKSIYVDAVDPARIGGVFDYDWAAGSSASSFERLGATGAIVKKKWADEHDLAIGSPITLVSESGKKVMLSVQGIHEPSNLNPLALGEVTVSDVAFDRGTFTSEGDRYSFVSGGRLPDLETAMKPYADAKVATKAQFVEDQMEWLNMMLATLYVLLAFSVIVSLFGIVNTLALSVVERTREVGMLRAVGMTRRQVRRMIRHESIITAGLGAAMGAAVGLFLGALTVGALSSEGLSFSMPVGTLIAFAVVAVLAGILAAIAPARRAAKLDVLAALQTE